MRESSKYEIAIDNLMENEPEKKVVDWLRREVKDQWSKIDGSLIKKWEYLYNRSLSEQPQNFDPPKGLQLMDRDRPPMD